MNPSGSYGRLGRLWVIPAVMLVTSACGSRMDRHDIQAAERGGLAAAAASSQAAAGAPGTDAAALDSGGGDLTAAPDAGAGAVSSGGASSAGSSGSAATGSARSSGTAAGTATGAAGSKTVTTGTGASAGTRTAAGMPGGATAGGSGAAAKSGAPAPGAGAAAGPATKAPVAVGSVATLSGPLGAFTKDYIYAIGVWVKWKNNHGGVNGHPLRHLITDDAGDPARYNAAVRQMTEEQGAIAFLHNTIGFAGGDLGYITQKRMPVIGHEGGTDFVYDNPFVFTPAASGSTYAYAGGAAIGSVTIPAGKKKLGVLACSDVKLCDNFFKVLTGPEGKEIGFEVVYQARPSLTQPDYTGECISARQAGAEVVITILDNNSMLRVARSCARQNYKPTYGFFDNVTLPSVAQDPNVDGAVVAAKAPPWVAKDLPGLAEIHQAFAEVVPGVEVNGAHVNGWVSAKTFDEAARNLPDKPTSEDVLNGLWSFQGNDLGGLTYPLTFPKMGNSPKKACWGVVVIQAKKFHAPKGSAVTCKQ
jgi:ABC-type branched-subunit amino acid transport system substrate-binding protein